MKKYLMIPLAALALAASGASAESNKSVKSYNPFEEMQKMQQEMDQVFARFHQRMMQESMFSSFPASLPVAPAVDLKDRGDTYLLKADIPGAKKSEITVTAKDGMLTIQAKSLREESEKKKDFLKHERFEGVYMRSMSLPADADSDKLKSDYKDGVLEVTIPKKKK